MLLVLALVLGCSDTPIEERTEAAQAKTRMPATVVVNLQPPELTESFRWETETVARVVRTMESYFHAAEGVVVRVDGAPAPPSVRDAPTAGADAWGISLALVGSSDALELRALTCAPGGGCEEEVTYTNADTPEVSATELAGKILERVGAGIPPGVAECVGQPPSADRYASLIAGRGAGVLYGLVQPKVPGDRSDDPLERAVYLDPKSGMAQWVAGRGRAGRGQLDSAAYSLGIAMESCPGHPGFVADMVKIELERGKTADAVALLDGLKAFADDPRLVPLRLDAWVRAGRLAEAEALGLRANETFPEDPRIAEVLAELSLAQDKGPEYERWLAAWARRDPRDPEPVRRLVAIQARGARWDEAWEAVEQLQARGAAEEARLWRVTAGLALKRYEEAAEAAEPQVAARIRARAALEGAGGFSFDLSGDPSPEARVARGTAMMWSGSASDALREADAALSERPWWPEALALRVDALAALGFEERAEQTRKRWYQAEPPVEP